MKLNVHEFVFTDALTPECHASTLLQLRDGGILAAWFAGSKESHDDVTIYAAARRNGRWSVPRRITAGRAQAQWNPVLFRLTDGRIALFYKEGNPPIAEWRTFVQYSSDEGENWTEAQELVPGDVSGGRGPVKDKPIRLSNGWIAAGGSTERGPWRPFADISKDDGATFEKHPIPVEGPDADRVNLIQPTLWEYPEGVLHAFMRSNCGRIYRSESADGGESWTPAVPTVLLNNNSGIDLTETADGKIALLCNPVAEDWGKRSPISLFVSADHGETFERILDIECADDGELSYPAVIADGEKIRFTYTWKRKRIRYGEIDLSE